MGEDGPGDASNHVLVVEDDPGAARLFQEAFRELDEPVEITVANDGEQALAILGHHAETAEPGIPDAVFLDLDIPTLGGQEVLRKIRTNPSLSTVPVIICSHHTEQRIVEECYRLRANAYFVKPDRFDDFLDILREMRRFWTCDDVDVPEVDPEQSHN